jgi:telomere length regulation protein
MLQCISSVAGIGAMTAQIKTLLQDSEATVSQAKQVTYSSTLKDMLSVLQAIFETPNFLHYVHSDLHAFVETVARRQVIWKEFISLVAAGRVLSTASQAYSICKDDFTNDEDLWLVSGSRYAVWLGREICNMISKIEEPDEEAWRDLSALFLRSLSLGYSGNISSFVRMHF